MSNLIGKILIHKIFIQTKFIYQKRLQLYILLIYFCQRFTREYIPFLKKSEFFGINEIINSICNIFVHLCITKGFAWKEIIQMFEEAEVCWI